MAGKNPPLNLLLCDADDRTPALQKLDGDVARRQGAAESVNPLALWPEDKTPDDLASQGWGVIVPEGPVGDRLIQICKPLLDFREAQIQRESDRDHRDLPIHRVKPDLTYAEADTWRRQIFAPGDDIEVDVPRYQLILGNLDQVGMATQLTQAQDGFVGRLAFDDEAGYEAYIDKVLKWEKKKAEVGQAYAKFFTVHDGTGATMDAFEKLVGPGLAIAKKRRDLGNFPARDILSLGDVATPSQDEFLRACASDDPTVMFSLSHGAGAPKKLGWKSEADQRARQGAMSFGSSAGLLTASDVAARKFLPGGVWFMFACFGAGTPQRSAYRHWLELLAGSGQEVGDVQRVMRSLPKEGQAPFIAALPQTVLRNPNGPLAFIGHIDLAWSFGYEELDSEKGPYNRPGRFISVLRSLLEGHRMGPAFREFMRFFGQVNTALTTQADERQIAGARKPTPEEEARRGHLWMLRQDLAGYMVLGDPAVRLNIDPNLIPKKAAPAGRLDLSSLMGFAVPSTAPPPPATLPSQAPPSIEKLENAICQAIVGQKTLEQCAKDVGISPTELRNMMEQYRQAGRAAINRR